MKEKVTGSVCMAVKSINTVDLTEEELEELEKKVKGMTFAQLMEFRGEFEADEMGFVGRKEGI
jgi:hypothetical protein